MISSLGFCASGGRKNASTQAQKDGLEKKELQNKEEVKENCSTLREACLAALVKKVCVLCVTKMHLQVCLAAFMVVLKH